MTFCSCNFFPIHYFCFQIYVELYGPEKQPAGVPDKVHLQIRHLSGSSFRAGDNSIKHYRQSVGSYRKITFDRSAVTKEGKCNRKKAKGRNTSKWVLMMQFHSVLGFFQNSLYRYLKFSSKFRFCRPGEKTNTGQRMRCNRSWIKYSLFVINLQEILKTLKH